MGGVGGVDGVGGDDGGGDGGGDAGGDDGGDVGGDVGGDEGGDDGGDAGGGQGTKRRRTAVPPPRNAKTAVMIDLNFCHFIFRALLHTRTQLD